MNSMPFRQLKSFLKILIGVQYKKKTAATLTVRQRRHSPGIFSAADEVCTPFTQGACPLMSGSWRKHSISSFICLSSIPTNLSACASFFVHRNRSCLKIAKCPNRRTVIANQWCSAQRIKIVMIASGNHTVIYRRLVWQSPRFSNIYVRKSWILRLSGGLPHQ